MANERSIDFLKSGNYHANILTDLLLLQTYSVHLSVYSLKDKPYQNVDIIPSLLIPEKIERAQSITMINWALEKKSLARL
jgi:hypothetical protein